MINTPEIKMGVVGVSRDCFPAELTKKRLANVAEECKKLNLNFYTAETIVENEADAMKAVAEMKAAGVNALTIYLGNFGPEGPLTICAKKLGVPYMLVAAAEESKNTLMVDGRGDAFCGMLNASLNAGLRGMKPFIPAKPVGLPYEVAKNIEYFVSVARVVVGLKNLKVFSFGPRPHDFYACNAPIVPLYNLGVEVMENSELDLFELYEKAGSRTSDIAAKVKDMEKELAGACGFPGKLPQIAQFELTLEKFFEDNLGASEYGVFANKCWPAFQTTFHFVPCYVNSRLTGRGIPVACEVDIYGAVSEYMAQLASNNPVTLLDINNTVPADLETPVMPGVANEDLFMGFHCGNTACQCLSSGFAMKYQLIMHRLLEPDKEPDVSCGTIEGTLKAGETTMFRLQHRPDGQLQSYIAEGSVLDVDPCTFGGTGVIAIPDFARFYRHVLLEKQYPHHGAFAFHHCGKALYDATTMLGVSDIATPQPISVPYPTENPF